MLEKIDQFIESLASFRGKNVFNPWADYNPALDYSKTAYKQRQANLKAYLSPRLGQCPYMVVAEAMGYQGGHFSGIAITCERMLLNYHKDIKAIDVLREEDLSLYGGSPRTSNPESLLLPNEKVAKEGFSEPTDTVVWNAIKEAHADTYRFLLWNIFPFHPYKEGNMLTNRTPSPEEQVLGYKYTKMLMELNGEARMIAVGKKSAETLSQFGIEAIALRHPANGGAALYKKGFLETIQKYGI